MMRLLVVLFIFAMIPALRAEPLPETMPVDAAAAASSKNHPRPAPPRSRTKKSPPAKAMRPVTPQVTPEPPPPSGD